MADSRIGRGPGSDELPRDVKLERCTVAPVIGAPLKEKLIAILWRKAFDRYLFEEPNCCGCEQRSVHCSFLPAVFSGISEKECFR